MSESSDQQIQQQDIDCCHLKWSDYKDHMPTMASQLFHENSMVDVTLVIEDERIYAHRIVLSACSTLLQELLSEAKEDHPTIIISGVSADDVRLIVEYCYSGQLPILPDGFDSLSEAATLFQINGLMTTEELNNYASLISTKETSDDSQEIFDTFVPSNTEINESLDDTFIKNDDENDGFNYQEENKIQQNDLINQIQMNNHAVNFDDTNNPSGNDIINKNEKIVGDNNNKMKKKIRKKECIKREYSDEMLKSAIKDLKNGQSLIEASKNNGIPRSTLYMRAKTLRIKINAARNEYSNESMSGAISAVLKGSSLQNASELFSIPKTVLWRRIQKEGYHIIRSDSSRSYDNERRAAAIKALERGENLTKVSLEFKIPKTTLFRDKARLVNQGKLPSSYWKKRKPLNEDLKKKNIEEAVNACRNGIMSQAAAALKYGIPKTTIWRRLQRVGKKNDEDAKTNEQVTRIKQNKKPFRSPVVVMNKSIEDVQHSLYRDSEDIPIAYIDEGSLTDIPQNSVVILADVGDLDLDDNRDTIIVNTNHDQDYVSSIGMNEDSSSYTPVRS